MVIHSSPRPVKIVPQMNESQSQGHYEVTPLELFFDLAFVFGVSQLSHHLASDLTWRGGCQTVLLLLAVMSVWVYTSWAATFTHADRRQTRWMVLTVMLVGLFMSAGIAAAFGDGPWRFLLPYLAIQIGRTGWTIAVARDDIHRDHFWRVLAWLAATLPFWLLGAAMDPGSRLLLWSGAILVDLLGTVLGHPVPRRTPISNHVEFDANHMVERCRLLLLIALGEAVFSIGAALTRVPFTLPSTLAATLALASTGALWFILFGRSNQQIALHAEESSDPMHVSHFALIGLLATVLGLIVLAVANEKIIAHPTAYDPLSVKALRVGGPLLVIASQAWYLRVVLDFRPRRHLVGCLALLGAGLITIWLPGLGSLGLIAALTVAIAFAVEK